MVHLISVLFVLVVIFLLSIGIIFAGKRLRGSCGGVAVLGPNGEPLSCDTCPHRPAGSPPTGKQCPRKKPE